MLRDEILNAYKSPGRCHICKSFREVYVVSFKGGSSIERCKKHFNNPSEMISTHPLMDLNEGQARLVVMSYIARRRVDVDV